MNNKSLFISEGLILRSILIRHFLIVSISTISPSNIEPFFLPPCIYKYLHSSYICLNTYCAYLVWYVYDNAEKKKKKHTRIKIYINIQRDQSVFKYFYIM